MRQDDARDLENFLNEFDRETDRGLALVGAAVIDEKLEQTLRAFFRDDEDLADRLLKAEKQGPLSSFAVRADAALALGLLVPFEYDEIKLIAKIRNRFAHQRHGTTFKSPEIVKLCAKLRSPLPPMQAEDEPSSRLRFTTSVIITYLRLYYRPELALRERRLAKAWVSEDDVRWDTLPADDPRVGQQSSYIMVWLKQKGAPDLPGVPFILPVPRCP
ncbi:MltR family transcriptional regulator [Dongia deserti]|uniref:MltR family transcriptional regulator n=1 Tax=Dongia deserti TaxID=2268030 RepID=UPI000E64BD7A|nr:MltR family transcriptional regulator [Dongia deserti]